MYARKKRNIRKFKEQYVDCFIFLEVILGAFSLLGLCFFIYFFVIGAQVDSESDLDVEDGILQKQVSIKIFFLDWEKPRRASQQQNDLSKASISVWRTLFAVNEWNELQSNKKFSVSFLLLFTLFWMNLGLHVTSAAEENYFNSTLEHLKKEKTTVLEFYRSSKTFFLALVVNLSFNYAIYHRFFEEYKPIAFLDFCALAKISLIVIDEKYHGFYLHCDSDHDYADVDLEGICSQIKAQESGLLPVSSGLQLEENFKRRTKYKTYEIIFSSKFIHTYEEIISKGHCYAFGSKSFSNVAANLFSNLNVRYEFASMVKKPPKKNNRRQSHLKSSPLCPELLCALKARKKLSVHFRTIILKANTRSLSKLRSENIDVADGSLFLQKIWKWTGINLSFLPSLLSVNHTIFIPDHECNFESTIFLGHCLDLWLLSVYAYIFFFMFFQSDEEQVDIVQCRSLACALTYILDICLKAVRKQIGSQNLAKKTLIEDKFLL
eukprot:snap_masked-scaffold_5-processed-gene-8.41-mRNA-1 protein AED:0.52 eAED:0.56 QI:0/0/0/0.5/1/1/2/0/491